MGTAPASGAGGETTPGSPVCAAATGVSNRRARPTTISRLPWRNRGNQYKTGAQCAPLRKGRRHPAGAAPGAAPNAFPPPGGRRHGGAVTDEGSFFLRPRHDRSEGFRPAGRVPFSAMRKEPKNRRGSVSGVTTAPLRCAWVPQATPAPDPRHEGRGSWAWHRRPARGEDDTQLPRLCCRRWCIQWVRTPHGGVAPGSAK